MYKIAMVPTNFYINKLIEEGSKPSKDKQFINNVSAGVISGYFYGSIEGSLKGFHTLNPEQKSLIKAPMSVFLKVIKTQNIDMKRFISHYGAKGSFAGSLIGIGLFGISSASEMINQTI